MGHIVTGGDLRARIAAVIYTTLRKQHDSESLDAPARADDKLPD